MSPEVVCEKDMLWCGIGRRVVGWYWSCSETGNSPDVEGEAREQRLVEREGQC